MRTEKERFLEELFPEWEDVKTTGKEVGRLADELLVAQQRWEGCRADAERVSHSGKWGPEVLDAFLAMESEKHCRRIWQDEMWELSVLASRAKQVQMRIDSEICGGRSWGQDAPELERLIDLAAPARGRESQAHKKLQAAEVRTKAAKALAIKIEAKRYEARRAASDAARDARPKRSEMS